MKFKEIDVSPGGILEKCPIEIEVIFKYDFHNGALVYRYQLLSDPKYRSFAYYGDYWDFIEAWKTNLVFGEDGTQISDLTPYYEVYSNGFIEGYYEFEDEIKELNLIFQDRESNLNKIFNETLTKLLTFASRGEYYPSDNPEPIPIIKKELLFDGGKKAGRAYKAWYYIIHNYIPFVPIFRNFYSEHYRDYEEGLKKRSVIPTTQTQLQAVINEIEKDLDQNSDPGNTDKDKGTENKFNRMPMNEIRSHFKPLTEKKNPSGEIWMTLENFNIFLKRSFGGETHLLKPKINIGNRGKFAIVKLFYLFYQKSLNENLQENSKKDPFLNLLKDAFDLDDFMDLRGDNFKVDKSKYDWN